MRLRTRWVATWFLRRASMRPTRRPAGNCWRTNWRTLFSKAAPGRTRGAVGHFGSRRAGGTGGQGSACRRCGWPHRGAKARSPKPGADAGGDEEMSSTHVIPDDIYVAIGEAWAKSGQAKATVAEHGGRVVTDKDSARVIRTGSGAGAALHCRRRKPVTSRSACSTPIRTASPRAPSSA